MKRPYYIFNAGRLRRKDNTLFFEPSFAPSDMPPHTMEASDELSEEILLDTPAGEGNESGDEQTAPAFDAKNKRVVPIDDVDSFFIFGEMTFNTRFLNFLSQHSIPLHVFNYYGFYAGSYYPREYLHSGFLFVHQVEFYQRQSKRLHLAQKFVAGAAANMLKNLRYYNNRDADVQMQINAIERYVPELATSTDIPTLMGLEGNIRQQYYGAFRAILKEQYDFEKRVKHPPDNAVNALISFGNALVYTACLTEIYRTQLSPLISFLHEPGERRFSLALDLAEIFKPLLADRILFKMLNQKMLTHNDFDKALNFCYLKPEGRKKFTREFEEKMTTTIEHRKLKRKVSYRRLIRLECYKLIKHLTGAEEYEPFTMWW
jgi:CRISPR-associated protein Cas1